MLLITLFRCFDNLDEMSEFLRREYLAKLKQVETESLNSPISIQKIEFVINNLYAKKTQSSVISLVNSIKRLRKNSPDLT